MGNSCCPAEDQEESDVETEFVVPEQPSKKAVRFHCVSPEFKPGEGTACESPKVEGCMDTGRIQYLRPRAAQKPLPERKVCYNACIDDCVMGRTQDGFARPQCPLVNRYSEGYSVWQSYDGYEKLDPGKEVAKAAAGFAAVRGDIGPGSSIEARAQELEAFQQVLDSFEEELSLFKERRDMGLVIF